MGDKEEFYRTVLDNVADGVYFCDRDRRVTFWNNGAKRITGYSAEDVVGHACSDNILVHVDERGVSLCRDHCPVAATIADGQPRETQAFLHHKQGHRLPVVIRTNPIVSPEGQIQGAVETFSDNSTLLDALRRLDALSVENETDALTGTANRRGMVARLQACLADPRTQKNCAVLYADIDNFKVVNDTYGHDTGDAVLKMVASTLAYNVRSSDLLARWGGEEFVGLLYRMTPETLQTTAEKLRSLVQSAFIQIDGERYGVTVSIGATFIKADDTLDSVIARADRLLYESKTQGRNRVTIDAYDTSDMNGGGEIGCKRKGPASSSCRRKTATRTQ
jgi:diguanylate cyclase (GGDEF)-like protein/PAS domain S-box-containing protein